MTEPVLGGWCRGLLMFNCLLIGAATLYNFAVYTAPAPLPAHSAPAPQLLDWPNTKYMRAHA